MRINRSLAEKAHCLPTGYVGFWVELRWVLNDLLNGKTAQPNLPPRTHHQGQSLLPLGGIPLEAAPFHSRCLATDIVRGYDRLHRVIFSLKDSEELGSRSVSIL